MSHFTIDELTVLYGTALDGRHHAEQEVAHLHTEADRHVQEIAELKKEILKGQAREKVLMDAMQNYFTQYPHMMKGYVVDALNQPSDNTALKAALAAERNRCVTELLSRHANGNRKYDTRDDCVFAIRALGDEA